MYGSYGAYKKDFHIHISAVGLHLSTLWIWLHWGTAWGKKVWRIIVSHIYLMFKCISEFLNVFMQYWKWVRIHILHQWPEPPILWGQCYSLNYLAMKNILQPALWSDIASVFSTRTWITNIYSHSPLDMVHSPLESLMKTSTSERGYPVRTIERQKTGENGKWHHGNDTAHGSHGVDMFLDDRVCAMKEFPH